MFDRTKSWLLLLFKCPLSTYWETGESLRAQIAVTDESASLILRGMKVPIISRVFFDPSKCALTFVNDNVTVRFIFEWLTKAF